MRLLVVALLAGMMATGGFLLLQIQEPSVATGSEKHVVQIGGGTVTHSPALQGGERFLKQVPLPEHLANPYEPDAANEVPGDGYDDELLVTQRRETDHSWWTKPVTGRVEIFNVHGTAANPVCICDVEFVLSNETKHDPYEGFVWLRDSSHVLVDNVTVYGGQLGVDDSHHVTVSRSQFWNAFIGTFASLTTDILVWDNDFSQAEGPLGKLAEHGHHEAITGVDGCWPNPSCGDAGVGQAGLGIRWRFLWNYVEAGALTGFVFNYKDFHVEHNTLLNSVDLVGGYHGDNYVGWNLMRGGTGGIDLGASGTRTAQIENNSVAFTGEPDAAGQLFIQYPGVVVRNNCICTVENNDFIGYGSDLPTSFDMAGSPALDNRGGHVIANDNYWGTVFDPTLPGDQIIRTQSDGTTIVETWRTQPIHPLEPIAVSLNEQDAQRWSEETPKRIPENQQHIQEWVDEGCEFSVFELCKVPPGSASLRHMEGRS